jgi:hypothetical protein
MEPKFTQAHVDSAIDFVIDDAAVDRARTVRYSAVFSAAGLPNPQDLHLGGESDLVTAFMKAFHDRCIERELPPLDALVVHVAGSKEGKPGSGYFKVNGYVDPFSDRAGGKVEDAIAANSFWVGQLQEVREWGVKHRRQDH